MTSTVSWAEYKKPLGLSLGITALVWLLLFTIVIFDPNTHNTALLPNKRDDSGAPIQQVSPLCVRAPVPSGSAPAGGPGHVRKRCLQQSSYECRTYPALNRKMPFLTCM